MGDGLDDAFQSSSQNTKAISNAVLDKYTVQEKIVPLLKAMKTKEPAVIMAALAVFKQVGKIADTDFLATECLPVLWSFSLGPLLDMQQFQEYMKLIKSLSRRIETEQMRKLRELSTNSNTTRNNDLMNIGSTDAFFGSNGNNVGGDDFERLVLGKKTSSKTTDTLGDSLRPQPQRSQSSRPVNPAYSHWGSSGTSTTNQNSSNGNSFGHSYNSNSLKQSSNPSLNNFTALKPTTPSNTSIGSSLTNGFSAMTPMQPSKPQTPQWSPNMKSSYSQPQPSFGVPPPPSNPASAYPQFSIAPPPSQNKSPMHSQYGNLTNGISNPSQKPKTGLDAYESLL
ncbi:MAG: hypothetical protein Q9204_007487 [Flavoplaca sp. TL-2023a]